MKAINRTKQFQQITSILNSLTGAAEKWKIDTALAKSGIPILQGLIAWNNWRTSKQAHKMVPSHVIEELSKAYGIDIPDSADRQEVEKILLKAGIEQPEQAYEIILRRLTARINKPDLVDYLGSAFDDISVHLSKLITATRSKYYLRRIEEILALYPENEDEKIPCWFRKTGPIAADFDSKTVIRRDVDLNVLHEQVDKEIVTVLVGDEASGKSVISRQLGLEYQREAKFDEIYMLEMGAHERVDLPTLTAELSDIKGLVIIDDAHLNPRLLSKLYNKLKKRRSLHTLIVTRPSLWGSLDQRYDSLGDKKIRKAAVKIDSINIATAITKQFSSEFGIEDWQAEAIATNIRKSKGHLWHISYALEGALTSGGKGNVISWIAESVRLDLQRMERKMEGANPDFPEICVAISPIYTHEIPVAEPFLTKSLGFTVNTLNSLCQIGYILRIEKDDEVYYALPHSAIAQAYWNSSGIYRKRLGFQNEDDAYYQYALSDVCNGLMLIMSLEKDQYSSILKRIQREDKLFPLIEVEESADAISKWISSGLADNMVINIDNEENEENLYRLLSRKIDEADALDAVLIFCAIADSLHLVSAIEEFNTTALSEKISALENSDDLVKTINQLVDTRYNEEYILEELNLSQIANTLSNLDDLDELQNIIESLDSYLGYGLIEELDQDKLAKRLLDEWTPLWNITSFLNWAIEQDETFGKELIATLDEDEGYKLLCHKVTGAVDICDAAEFIELINTYSEYDWEWLLLLDQEALRELMESEEVENGLYLFEVICGSGVMESELRNFIGLIRDQELRERCEEYVNDM